MSIKVEIGQYREVNKGALKAFFSMVIYPQCLKICNCQHFENGDRSWFNFPSEKYEKDGKTEYKPIVSIFNKEFKNELEESVLEAISQIKKELHHEGQANHPREISVRSNSRISQQDLPF